MESTSNPSWLEKIQQTVRKFLEAVNPFQTPVDTSGKMKIVCLYKHKDFQIHMIHFYLFVL